MARESCIDLRRTISYCVETGHFDSSTKDQLEYASSQLVPLLRFLYILEKDNPENSISTQLRPLLVEAYDVFSEIHSHVKDRGPTSDAIRMISEVLQIIKRANIAERIKNSKPSRSSCRITMDMVKHVVACLDGAVELVMSAEVIPALLENLEYLGCFLNFTAKRCLEHEKMKDLFILAEDVAYTAAHIAIAFPKSAQTSQSLGRSLKFLKFLERINPTIEHEWRQLYISVLKASYSSRSKIPIMDDNLQNLSNDVRVAWKFTDLVIYDLEKLRRRETSLTVSFSDRFQWLLLGLNDLCGFLGHFKEGNGWHQEILFLLLSYMEPLAIEAACTIYSLYDVDLEKNTELEHMLLPLQVKFDHLKLERILFKKLSMKETVMDLPEVLTFFRTFLMDPLEQCKDQAQITDVLTLIQSVTTETVSFIDSLSEESFRDIQLVMYHLGLKYKFYEAAIRQMCPIIFASSTPDHPMINLLSFLPVNLEVVDSYLTMLRSPATSLDSYITMRRFQATSSSCYNLEFIEYFMGLQEYILEKLLLENEANLKSNATDKVKGLYHGLLVLVTFLVDPTFEYIEYKNQNDLSTEIGIIAIEAEAAIRLSYEDDLDSRKSRKVNLVLQHLTVSFSLIKSERNFMELLKLKATLGAQVLDLMEDAHEELTIFRAFFIDLLRQQIGIDILDDLLKQAEVVAFRSAFSYESFMDRRSSEKISDFLKVIDSVKVKVREVCLQVLDASRCNVSLPDVKGLLNFLSNHLDRLLNSDAGAISFLKDRIPEIKERLVYLGSFLADIVQYRNIHEELQDLVKRVQNVDGGTIYVFFFSFRGNTPAWVYMLCLSDVKQLLKYVEAEVKKICLKVPILLTYSFPKTDGLGFISCFLGKLEELLSSKLNVIIDLKHQIRSVKEGLLCLRDHFSENHDEHDEAYGLVTSATEVAYEAEYIIDSCLVSSHPVWYKSHQISEVVNNIKLVNKVVSETGQRKKIGVTVHETAKPSIYLAPSLLANAQRENEEMEDFQEAIEKIKKELLRGSSDLDVISIVGMPGIGKTTLAEKIYNDVTVTRHFDVHAKCRVTQVYSWRELLLTILNDVLEPVDRTEKGDGEIADELRQYLLSKRFLILIDDVWDCNVWDSLQMCLRQAPKGSRIILTTRLCDVASYAQCESKPHHLRLLRDDESWTLLEEEVFQGESCPPELREAGFRLAKSCGGLPLFIVLVAGMLKEQKKQADLWNEVEECLDAQNMGSLGESMRIIGFSYQNLPHHLKPCFLYFGGFLKGKDIHVSKLTRLWLSEGFVQAPEDGAAHDFLEDLIRRNLLMGMKKRPNGTVKMCRIHDMLHQFCLEKAKQENFLHRINRDCAEDIFPEKLAEYRLFVHSSQDQIEPWKPSCSNTRSLIFNDVDVDNLLWPRDISFIFDSFKLVKVLDLEAFNIGGIFPSEIQFLIHMRYFAVQTDANVVPSSIAKLWNLETLVVRGLGGEVILPSSILRMVKLRHILVKNRASFSPHESMGESLAQLDNLKTLSTPRLSYSKETEIMLRKMPNLRELSCIISGTFGYSDKVKGRCVLFPRLEFLSHLESLKLVFNSYPAKLPHVFSFPSRLRELTLSKFRLPWSQISTIAELPNLEILKLLLRAFEGDEWVVNDSEFPDLKYLELHDLNIARWSVSDDAFPMLEHLVLTKCKQLEEIPSRFEDAVSLKSVEVNWCSWSVANSAQKIQTTQREDMANDAFTATIQPPDWARISSA